MSKNVIVGINFDMKISQKLKFLQRQGLTCEASMGRTILFTYL